MFSSERNMYGKRSSTEKSHTVIERGYIRKRVVTRGKPLYTERSYAWRGVTHGKELCTEGTYSAHGKETARREIIHGVRLGRGLVCDMRLQLSSGCISDAISEVGKPAGNLSSQGSTRAIAGKRRSEWSRGGAQYERILGAQESHVDKADGGTYM